MREDLVRIPRRFFDDHNERDLPAPDAVRQTERFAWIPRHHPDMAELISDAEHYAWGGWSSEDGGMGSWRPAARRLLEALAKAGVPGAGEALSKAKAEPHVGGAA